jgi:hypothetical protein
MPTKWRGSMLQPWDLFSINELAVSDNHRQVCGAADISPLASSFLLAELLISEATVEIPIFHIDRLRFFSRGRQNNPDSMGHRT